MNTRLKAHAVKGWLWQGGVALAVAALFYWLSHNLSTNLAARGMEIDFGFLAQRAGFDIPFRLVAWDGSYPYGWALYVSGVNTLFASALIIVLASLLGLALALMRLSGNPLAAGTSRTIVEVVRNTPQLTQIVFFYIAVLQVLPPMRQSITWFGSMFLNVRGLYVPAPSGTAYDAILAATCAVVVLAAVFWRRLGWHEVPRLVVLPPVLVLGAIIAGVTANWDYPSLKGFNFTGGTRVPPELLALVLGIGVYTSVFIAEIIRAAIQGIHRGQGEAARSLGLSSSQAMFLVILPQALRILIPPLTSQYLNIIKSTTLGAAIAYPEVLQIFARTVLNQSGRAVEVMTLVLGVFLAVNLLASAAMNVWNRRLALQGR
ncbi:MAG: ABC transporter permease subunit [Acetobacteraceae bacterium]|nr:ABC transporter permease subunit [Acetobacteraceae bacterium]